MNFVLYSVFLFVWVKRSTFTRKWVEFQDLRWLCKDLMNLLFFFTNFLAEGCNRAQVLLKRFQTKGKLVYKYIKKLYHADIYKKNSTCNSCFSMVLSIYKLTWPD